LQELIAQDSQEPEEVITPELQEFTPDSEIEVVPDLQIGAGLHHAGVAGARAGLRDDGARFLAAGLLFMCSLSSRP
jgi:hypothetical protein